MSTVITETDQYRALVESCGVVDRSERGKLALSGAGAAEFLNGQVTNEIVSLVEGQGCYAAFLTHKGKMLGDLRVLLAAPVGDRPQELLLDTERVALQALFDMIRRFQVGYEVILDKRTLQRGLLSLVGPKAREVLAAAGGPTTERLPTREHANVWAQLDGVSVLCISTDLGVDLLMESEETGIILTALVAAGAVAVSEAVAETVRIEHGRPRYGVDLDESTIPQEAALNERAVNFTKGCYVGQETVARLFYRGKPNRHLRGLVLSGPAHSGDELRLGERVVGTLGSVTHSPRHGHIALALVRREVEPDAELTVAGGSVTARLAVLPFGD